MDYEKKYKEANDKIAARFGTNVAKEIFTDLYESEDERIRKALINGFNKFDKSAVWYNGITNGQILAWLEKQGGIDNCPLECSTNTVMTDSKKNQVEPKFKVGDSISKKHNSDINKFGIFTITSIADNKYWYNDSVICDFSDQDLWEFVERTKFKKGDWVFHNTAEFIYMIQTIGRDGYGVISRDGKKSVVYYSAEINYRLWTIEDAKDGDVLVVPPVKGSEHSEQIFIFKEIKDREYVKNAVEYYCRCMDNEFASNERGFMGQSDDYFTPATKEQRDTLMKAMKDAGYEWNAEKKELKKIEQKPTDKIEPKFHEGDWVVQGSNILKIRCVGDEYYCFETVGGYVDDMLVSEIDSLYHLWTIQDAKDGDVLIDEDIDVIGIFEGIEGMCWHSKFYYSNTTKELYGVECGGSHQKEFAKPATKEQRDQLEKAMADAGYTFDFEKKELKKIEPKFKVGDKIRRKISRIYDKDMQVARIGKDYYLCNNLGKFSSEQIPFSEESNYELVEQKPVDKVEPKFHEGEWITNNIETVQITGYDIDYGYQVDYKGNLQHRDTDIIEKEYNLWTIDDAKDGDILASDNSIFIFQEDYIAEKPIAYCGLMNGCFIVEEEDAFWINEKCYPATKEQRDTLFAKMREAEYEWNAEKKELKKIKKNTDVVHEYFSELLENDNSDNIDDYAYQCAYCMSHDWLKDTATWDDVEKACKLGAEWSEKHHKSSWSEDDERICRNIVNDIANDKSMCKYEISKGICDEQINWLKSLRPQNKWRPSDEQMKALHDLNLTGNISYVGQGQVLIELYNDLKKLTE